MKPTVLLSRPSIPFAALLLAALLCCPLGTAHGTLVSAKQALLAATGWLSLDRASLDEPLGTSVLRVETFSDSSSNALYYVVYLNPSGFVIMPADNRVEPIISFAPAGTFDPSTNNPLGALVSADLANRVGYARQTSALALDTAAARAQSKWQQLTAGQDGSGVNASGLALVSEIRVAPFVLSTWDQGTAGNVGTTACYNYYTPPYGDGVVSNYWAGCVATAMAQIIRYHQFPTTGVGYTGYTIYSDDSPLTYYLHGGDGAGGPYVWTNMPLVPTSSPTTVQCQAIGALVADAGASVGMRYYSSGSSGSPSAARSALVSTFLFANARYGWKSNNEIGSGLTNMINPNLDARYPVILSIEATNAGHAIIADGYGYSASTLYHHLNLGWSGTATAWYALPLVDTGIYTFTVVDGCVYNIYTNGSGEIISGRVLDQISRPVANATVTARKSGGSTYTTTTDTNGIYALPKIPSTSTFSITVSRTNYYSVSNSFSTTTSSDWAATSGNCWAEVPKTSRLPPNTLRIGPPPAAIAGAPISPCPC